ncbi:hypothetical protein GCM10027615_28840 [Plantactinospora veratri]
MGPGAGPLRTAVDIEEPSSAHVPPAAPGYATQMRPESVERPRFPAGSYRAETASARAIGATGAYSVRDGSAALAGR